MARMQGPATLPDVIADAAKVQALGLLEDTIILYVPKQAGPFDKVRRGLTN